jgi:3-oxoacyl-[acyl-carrier protein] reductase
VKLDGKVAIVTGGSRGLGRAIAEAYADEGATVVCAARSCPAASTAGEGAASRMVFDHVDVSRSESVRELMERTRAAHGRIDIVVANAGISRDGTIVKLTAEQWRETMDTNLAGTFYAISSAARHMRHQGAGRIITVSSSMAMRPTRGVAAYSASKAGIEALTRVAAVELGRHGILVNCIAPGFLNGGLGDGVKSNTDVWSGYAPRLAQSRPGELREAAHAAVFLAGPDSTYVNGAVIEVNGGMSWA